MDPERLADLLEQVRRNQVSVADAMARLRHLPFEDLGVEAFRVLPDCLGVVLLRIEAGDDFGEGVGCLLAEEFTSDAGEDSFESATGSIRYYGTACRLGFEGRYAEIFLTWEDERLAARIQLL